MLLVYDEKGFIEQAIMIGDFERLQAVYEANGKNTICGVNIAEPHKVYVRDGMVLMRPEIEIAGEVRPIRADGIDTLHFQVSPQAYKVTVKLNGVTVHQEDDTDGQLEFAVDHAGVYTLKFEAEFPYLPTELTLEAQ